MKLSTKAKNKRLVIAGATAGAVLLVASASAILINSNSQNDSTDAPATTNTSASEQDTVKQREAEEQIKQEAVEKTDKQGDTPSQPSASDGKVQVVITAANLTSDSLVIRALIYDISNTGTCTMTLQKSGSGTIVTKTAGVQASTSYSTCKGFDVPLSELPKGDWQITINYKDGNATGSASHLLTI